MVFQSLCGLAEGVGVKVRNLFMRLGVWHQFQQDGEHGITRLSCNVCPAGKILPGFAGLFALSKPEILS